MTYAIVIAILVLALVAVVVAVVVTTDEDYVSAANHGPDEKVVRSEIEQKPHPPVAVANATQEENRARDIGIVDVPEKADRNAGAFGV
jgi:hypothetical protein